MDLLATLVALFGLAAGTTPEALAAHLTALKAQLDGTAALKARLGLPETADLAALTGKVDALAAAAAGAGKADTTTLATIAALQTQVATLTAQINGDQVTRLVDQALADGKLIPAMRDWALALGKESLAQLQGYIDKAPKLGLGAAQSGGKEGGGDGGKPAALSGVAADVIARLGISAEQYAKAAPAAA